MDPPLASLPQDEWHAHLFVMLACICFDCETEADLQWAWDDTKGSLAEVATTFANPCCRKSEARGLGDDSLGTILPEVCAEPANNLSQQHSRHTPLGKGPDL